MPSMKQYVSYFFALVGVYVCQFMALILSVIAVLSIFAGCVALLGYIEKKIRARKEAHLTVVK